MKMLASSQDQILLCDQIEGYNSVTHGRNWFVQ